VLERAPQWVAEVVGDDMATKLGGAMKDLEIDARLLVFFDHDSWKMVGVQDPILRCRLLRCQQQQKVTPVVEKGASITRVDSVTDSVTRIPSATKEESASKEEELEEVVEDEEGEELFAMESLGQVNDNGNTNGSSLNSTSLEATDLDNLVHDMNEVTESRPADLPAVSVPGEVS